MFSFTEDNNFIKLQLISEWRAILDKRIFILKFVEIAKVTQLQFFL